MSYTSEFNRPVRKRPDNLRTIKKPGDLELSYGKFYRHLPDGGTKEYHRDQEG